MEVIKQNNRYLVNENGIDNSNPIFKTSKEAEEYIDVHERINHKNTEFRIKQQIKIREKLKLKITKFREIKNGGDVRLTALEFEEFCNKNRIKLHIRTVGLLRKKIKFLNISNNKVIEIHSSNKFKTTELFKIYIK